MRILLSHLLLGAAAAFGATGASATVLTFDDLGGDGPVPLHYGGLDWSAGGWSVFGGAQDPYAPHSGSFRAAAGFDAADADTRIGFAAPTTFQGAWFSGLRGATVTFQMYLGGQRVATSATLDPGAVPAFLASGYAGPIDALVVSSPYQASYAMDDLTFAAPVPEPSTAALLALGAGALAWIGQRRRRDAAGAGR